MVKKNAHRKALEKIVANPAKFGFHNIIKSCIEENLFHRGRVIAQPDVTLVDRVGTVNLIEYKGNGNGEMLQRAHEQLENARWWYGKYRPNLSPEKIKTQIISGTDPKYKELFHRR